MGRRPAVPRSGPLAVSSWNLQSVLTSHSSQTSAARFPPKKCFSGVQGRERNVLCTNRVLLLEILECNVLEGNTFIVWRSN